MASEHPIVDALDAEVQRVLHVIAAPLKREYQYSIDTKNQTRCSLIAYICSVLHDEIESAYNKDVAHTFIRNAVPTGPRPWDGHVHTGRYSCADQGVVERARTKGHLRPKGVQESDEQPTTGSEGD